jgi:DNA-directed RNA polymerase specialized sigma24 family protein
MVRAGDFGAFGRLRQRHEAAARRLARILVSAAEIDDVVAEAFDRVLQALKRGGGPADGFRPYLLTATRRVCASRAEGQGAAGLAQTGQPESGRASDPGRPFLDPATSVDKLLIVGVYLSLPERFSALLWHLEIEQETPEEIAPLFGLSFNGLGVLERRARAAFRQTYLDAYTAQLDQAACMSVADMLGGYLRYALADGETAYVAAHLSQCAQCRAVYSELADLGATLRSAIAPVVLGSAAATYLPGPEFPAETAVDLMPTMVTGSRAGYPAPDEPVMEPQAASESSAGPGETRGLAALGLAGAGAASADGGAGAGAGGTPDGPRPGARPHRGRAPANRKRALVGVCVLALAAVIGVPIALAMTGGHKTIGDSAARLPDTAASAPSLPSQSAATSPRAATSPHAKPHTRVPAQQKKSSPSPAATSSRTSPSPKPTPTHSSPSPKPSPTRNKSPAPAADLSAAIDVYSFGQGGQVAFSVTDTGNAATGTLTATITLPSGSSMGGGGGHGHGHGNDFTCQATSSGATCQAGALSSGANAHGGIGFQLNGTNACGQAVSLSVSSGPASTSTSSPETIQCGGPGGGNGIAQRAVATRLLT